MTTIDDRVVEIARVSEAITGPVDTHIVPSYFSDSIGRTIAEALQCYEGNGGPTESIERVRKVMQRWFRVQL